MLLYRSFIYWAALLLLHSLMNAAACLSSSSVDTFSYSYVLRNAYLYRDSYHFEVSYNTQSNVRSKSTFQGSFKDGGFASKQIAELHQEAAQRSVEKGGEDYLDPKGRKEAYKQDAKLVAALAALRPQPNAAPVVGADGAGREEDKEEEEQGEQKEQDELWVAPLNVFVSTTINLETSFLWYFPRRIVMATVQMVSQIHKQSQNFATCLSSAWISEWKFNA
jgi:hypothetical protein